MKQSEVKMVSQNEKLLSEMEMLEIYGSKDSSDTNHKCKHNVFCLGSCNKKKKKK